MQEVPCQAGKTVPEDAFDTPRGVLARHGRVGLARRCGNSLRSDGRPLRRRPSPSGCSSLPWPGRRCSGRLRSWSRPGPSRPADRAGGEPVRDRRLGDVAYRRRADRAAAVDTRGRGAGRRLVDSSRACHRPRLRDLAVRDGRTTPDRTERRRVLEPATALVFGVFLAVITSVAVAAAPEHEHSASEAPHSSRRQAGPACGRWTWRPCDGRWIRRAGHGTGEHRSTGHAPIRGHPRCPDHGWQQEHQDWPELGAHFYRSNDWDGAFPAKTGLRLRDPEYLMYSRFLTGKWKLVAVAYVFDQDSVSPATDRTHRCDLSPAYVELQVRWR